MTKDFSIHCIREPQLEFLEHLPEWEKLDRKLRTVYTKPSTAISLYPPEIYSAFLDEEFMDDALLKAASSARVHEQYKRAIHHKENDYEVRATNQLATTLEDNPSLIEMHPWLNEVHHIALHARGKPTHEVVIRLNYFAPPTMLQEVTDIGICLAAEYQGIFFDDDSKKASQPDSNELKKTFLNAQRGFKEFLADETNPFFTEARKAAKEKDYRWN